MHIQNTQHMAIVTTSSIDMQISILPRPPKVNSAASNLWKAPRIHLTASSATAEDFLEHGDPMSAFQNYPTITPFLWFDQNADEAVDFYLTVFKNSRRLDALADTDAQRSPKKKTLTVSFELDGQKFTALNGGPMYKFNEAVSFVILCHTQAEIDDYWTKLTDGGSEVQCGWLKDKFGLCWQVVPANIGKLLSHPKAMQAMYGMKKLIIADLEAASNS
jgi:predicted 3-demethylubiquinone-9 3-methyltransferase (glyoxalase superfamily)